jgi:hypothetical protein
MKISSILGILLCFLCSCGGEARRNRLDAAKRVSLVKHVFTEVFDEVDTPPASRTVKIDEIKCLEYYPRDIREEFVSGVKSGRVRIGKVKDEKEVIIWRTEKNLIVCDENGIVTEIATSDGGAISPTNGGSK